MFLQYATNKSRAQLGQSDQQWEQRIVTDLDSALNKWADSLPSHRELPAPPPSPPRCSSLYSSLWSGHTAVRWDPEQTNEDFLAQAASLRAYHYYTQFAVHRKFTSSAHRESPLSFPSMIICTNGARWSIQALEVVYRRIGSPGHRNFVSTDTRSSDYSCLLMLGWLGDTVFGWDHLDDEHIWAEALRSDGQCRKGPGVGEKCDRDAHVAAIRVCACQLRHI